MGDAVAAPISPKLLFPRGLSSKAHFGTGLAILCRRHRLEGAAMLENVRADLEHARVINGLPPGWFSCWVKTPLHPGVAAVLDYRFGVWARRVRIPVLRQLLILVATILHKVIEVVTGVEISTRA